MTPLDPLRWCAECRSRFRPRSANHRFCSRTCQRRNARKLELRYGARELEGALVELTHLLRAGEPVPEVLVAVERVRSALDGYEAVRGRLTPHTCEHDVKSDELDV